MCSLQGFMLRGTIEAYGAYAEALPVVASQPLVAPAFIIIGGTEPGEGAIVTRDRDGPDNSRDEGVWSLSGDGSDVLWRRRKDAG